MRTGEILGITCTISGLLGPVDVTWIDPEGMKIPNHQSTGYAVTDGKHFFFGGVQATTMRIKAAKVASINSAQTYKCLMTSTADPPSLVAEESITLTPAIGNSLKRLLTNNFGNLFHPMAA